MKRSGLPPRTAELVARAVLQRTTSLQRGGHLERAAPMPRPVAPPKPPRRPGMPKAVTDPVDARDPVCARCGAAGHLERHHRRRKGMGGSRVLDVPSNLVRLCGWGNTAKCHGWVHTGPQDEAEGDGFRIPDGVDWRLVPVRYWDGWFLLDDAGDRHRVDAP